LFCLASRLFNIFPLSLMINIYQRKNPKRQIPLKEQFVMWFAGTLRFTKCDRRFSPAAAPPPTP
jgi:hypothetical protein